ncbi:MAG: hypothetical protein ACR2GZ_10925 [Solirubrobacteraceae bacterium]
MFGTGRGESLVIHLGAGAWGVVDVCRDPSTNDPVPLSYLDQIAVDPSHVVFLLATHWHDDHIDGLAETLTACRHADFAISAAYTGNEFRAVTLEAQSLDASRVEEMIKCFELLEGRPRHHGVKATANRVLEDKRIWWNDDETVDLTAIAPTNLALDRANQDIAAKLLPIVRRRRALGRITPNQASIAAILRTPAGCVLLGGDVEERNAGDSGWSAIVARQRDRRRPRSAVIKIPHHGSENAHHPGQWSELLEPRPISIVTPFASSRLPRRGDLQRLHEYSHAVYVSGSGAEEPADVEPRVRRAATADGVQITKTGQLGHVRLRKSMVKEESTWEIETGGAAYCVDTEPFPQAGTEAAQRSAGRRRGRRN